jgi:hypothetical protein
MGSGIGDGFENGEQYNLPSLLMTQ